MPNIVVIRPEITEEERDKRMEQIEYILSKILKTPVRLVDEISSQII